MPSCSCACTLVTPWLVPSRHRCYVYAVVCVQRSRPPQEVGPNSSLTVQRRSQDSAPSQSSQLLSVEGTGATSSQ